MATYTKKHKSDKALRSHLTKIRKRGGKATVEGKTINYKFDKGGVVHKDTKQPIIKVTLKKRTFEAEKYPVNSIERKKLNENSLTSQYMHNYKYIVYVLLGETDKYSENNRDYSFTNKADAEKFKEQVLTTGDTRK